MAKVTSTEKQQAIEERRWKVWRMRVVHKLDISEIVTQVKVSRRTVESDLAVMRTQRRDHYLRSKREEMSALDATVEVVEECEAIRRQAWADLLNEPKGTTVRARLMMVLLNAISKEVEIRQSLGLLDRAAEEVIVSDGNIRDLTDEEANKLADQLKEIIRGGTGGEEAPRKGRKAKRAKD